MQFLKLSLQNIVTVTPLKRTTCETLASMQETLTQCGVYPSLPLAVTTYASFEAALIAIDLSAIIYNPEQEATRVCKKAIELRATSICRICYGEAQDTFTEDDVLLMHKLNAELSRYSITLTDYIRQFQDGLPISARKSQTLLLA
jgi:hypothetical protein